MDPIHYGLIHLTGELDWRTPTQRYGEAAAAQWQLTNKCSLGKDSIR
jgi:hypothetical protein